MNLISEDYLMHYGVKGMKWGVRKQEYRDYNPGSNWRTNKAFYNLQTFQETRAGERLTKKEQKQEQKLIAKANKLNNKDKKKTAKLQKYQSKLINKADKYSGNYRRDARENKNEIDDMNKMGFKSAYWKQHVTSQSKQYAQEAISKNKRAGYSDRDAETWGTLSGSVNYLTTISSKKAFDTRISELKETRSNSIRLAKTYTSNKKALMNTPITATTTKKDLKKIYRKNLSLFE